MAERRAHRHALPAVRGQQSPQQLAQLETGVAGTGMAHQHLHNLAGKQHLRRQGALPCGHIVERVHLPQEMGTQRPINGKPQDAGIPGVFHSAPLGIRRHHDTLALGQFNLLVLGGKHRGSLIDNHPQPLIAGKKAVVLLLKHCTARTVNPDAAFFHQRRRNMGALHKNAGIAAVDHRRLGDKLYVGHVVSSLSYHALPYRRLSDAAHR